MKNYKYTIKQNIFYVLSPLLSVMQLFVKKPSRKWGISVMIRLFNEEYTIVESLLSLNQFADEVIVINNGCTDESIKKIDSVKERLSYELKIFKNDSKDYVELSNFALGKTSYQWIVRWDGDFIAYTTGKRNIIFLRSFLLSLSQKKYYLIYPMLITFAGDVFHLEKGKEYHSEQYIHSFHPKLLYHQKGKFEVLSVPFFYKIMRLKKLFWVHLGTVKPLKRILYRFYWGEWWKDKYYNQYPNYDDFLDAIILQKTKGNKFALAKKELEEIIQRSRRYTKEEFGDYPELMKHFVENPLVKVVYKNNRPHTREDLETLINI